MKFSVSKKKKLALRHRIYFGVNIDENGRSLASAWGEYQIAPCVCLLTCTGSGGAHCTWVEGHQGPNPL